MVEVFTLGHALCRSYSKVEATALTSTPKFEGVLPETCRVLVWLGGLEVKHGKARIWEPVRHKRELAPGTSSQVWRARGSKLI